MYRLDLTVVWHQGYCQVNTAGSDQWHSEGYVVFCVGQTDVSKSRHNANLLVLRGRHIDDILEGILSRTIEVAYGYSQYIVDWAIALWREEEGGIGCIDRHELYGLEVIPVLDKELIDSRWFQDWGIQGDIGSWEIPSVSEVGFSFQWRCQLHKVNLGFAVIVVPDSYDQFLRMAVLVHRCLESVQCYVNLLCTHTDIALDSTLTDQFTLLLTQVQEVNTGTTVVPTWLAQQCVEESHVVGGTSSTANRVVCCVL